MQSYSFLEPNWIFLFVYLLFCFAFFVVVVHLLFDSSIEWK